MIELDATNSNALVTAEIEKLDALASDLARLVRGLYPSAAELAEAPVLYKPIRISRPEPCLRGYDPAHDRVWSTGRIIIWSPARGWARTTDGLWRLEGEGR